MTRLSRIYRHRENDSIYILNAIDRQDKHRHNFDSSATPRPSDLRRLLHTTHAASIIDVSNKRCTEETPSGRFASCSAAHRLRKCRRQQPSLFKIAAKHFGHLRHSLVSCRRASISIVNDGLMLSRVDTTARRPYRAILAAYARHRQ